MASKSNVNRVILDIIQEGVQKGILHLNTGSENISGMQISINGKKVINFSSCSYLGLEHHTALKEGAKAAIDAYGTQFSSSRAYLSLGLYEELENNLSAIFQHKKVVVTATTTLGHIAAIPVLIEDGDAVLIDHQVHHSVQTAAGLLRSKNVYIEMIRHNNMAVLEEKIKHLKQKHTKIWYLADGVYSMFGDLCPVNDLIQLLDRYEQFFVYADDAHGMSYFGHHGSGYICSQAPLHPRMILATSLNKAFASGGGVLIFPDEITYKNVRTCGSTLITSGPLQPANLGAALASARVHLGPEINQLQDNLRDKLKFTQMLLINAGLPLISTSEAAIFFVGVAVPKIGYRIVAKMLERGFYVNLGIFPAVPIKNTGIRFTVTALHTYRQINDMVAALKEELETALREENFSLEQVYKSFRKENPAQAKEKKDVTSVINRALNFKATTCKSILDIDQREWNQLFEGRGAFDWKGLAFLEQIFSNNKLPEDNWEFDYILVTDHDRKIAAATFVTTALWKDDMLSPAEVSARIEALRNEDPYHLVSKITSTGSLITEGRHVYVNKKAQGWSEALGLLLEKINEIHYAHHSSGIILRDFTAADETVFPEMAGSGYFKAAMPDAYTVLLGNWHTPEEFFETLSRKNKMHFRTDVRRYYDQFDFITKETASPEDVSRWYTMYLAVKANNLSVNTFPLPEKFFAKAANSSSWEVNVLVHKETGIEMAVVFCYRSGNTYIPTVIGLDYKYLLTHKIYKQTLFRLLEKGLAIGCDRVQLGFGADMEKKKLNATADSVYSFVQLQDSFNAEFISSYKTVSS